MTNKNITDNEFESLLGNYDYKFQKGDLVKGVVCGYDSEGAIVDIGAKTAAVVPEREATLNPKEPIENILEKGKEYEFLIIEESST